MNNVKITRKALLTSVVALVICVTMLMGTTFAWFTDTASVNVNKIVSGNLNVALEYWDGNSWENAEGKSLNFIAKDGNTDILWEPGCTYNLPKLRISNAGNLSLKFNAVITGIDGDAKLNEAIDWTYAFTSDMAVGADPNELTEVNINKHGDGYPLLPADKADHAYDVSYIYLSISGSIDGSVGNEYQGLAIDGVAVTILATQYTYESDSNNNMYDFKATYPGTADSEGLTNNTDSTAKIVKIETAEQLFAFAAAVKGGNSYAGYTITLVNDIDLQNVPWTPIGQTGATEFKGVFDGNGKTIKNLFINNADPSASCSTGLFGWIESHGDEGVTVKNLTIDGADITGHHYVGAIVGYVYGTIENCHVKNAVINCTAVNDDANGDKCGTIAGYVGEDATIKNCTASKCAVTAGRDGGQIVGAAKPACVTGCSATEVTVAANGTSTGKNITTDIIGRIL